MGRRLTFPGGRVAFALCVFVVLATAIWTRTPKWLGDFDQSFYLTIAYDMERYGVFSNGVFDDVDSTVAEPPPGTFFAPIYPTLLYAVGKIDQRFGRATACVVEYNYKRRTASECEVYARPINLIHALFLTLGVLAIARAAELIRPGDASFYSAGAVSALALVTEANLFSFVMTEAIVFSLYSVTALAMLKSWVTNEARWRYAALSGLLLGMLVLARTAYVVLAPVLLILIFFAARMWDRRRSPLPPMLAFTACFVIMVVPWALRNQVQIGKFTLTQEYGALSLIERFAFNRMTPGEFALAFPYCVPVAGKPLVSLIAGPHAVDRFEWNTRDSFFEIGRGTRVKLRSEHKLIDPIIGQVSRAELAENWWRHILVSLPLAWCGMWAGGFVALLLVPAFAVAGFQSARQRAPLLLLYAVPAFAMLGLHAVLANHYTRYNMILIGPFAAGVAWLIAAWRERRFVHSRSPARAPTRS